MKQLEAIIAWTPGPLGRPRPETARQVAVLPPLRGQEAKRFAMRAGASSSALATLSEEGRITRLFIDFQTLVVRDGIDAQTAHRRSSPSTSTASASPPTRKAAEFEDPPEED